VKEKNVSGPVNTSALSGLSFSECEACRRGSCGLSEFFPFIGMRSVIEKGVKFLSPYYGPLLMLCYSCFKQAVKIDIRKKCEYPVINGGKNERSRTVFP
jgi:hypothetical protein